MKQFEYHSIVIDVRGLFGGKNRYEEFDHTFNALGREGWELVNTMPSARAYGRTRYVVCVFKREI